MWIKRAPMLLIEHIEMKLFASEESCVVSIQDTKEDYGISYRHLEHPLVSITEECRGPLVQTPPEQQFKLKRVQSVGVEDLGDCPMVSDIKEIELEEFPPFYPPLSEQARKTSGVLSFKTLRFSSPVARVRWRRVDKQRTGLVVKDVICLPRGHLLAHPDQHGAPQRDERAELAARGLTARLTIDCGWTTSQMYRRLLSLFHGRFGQSFSFTYLQCVPASRALFVPDPPVEGWTGEQVLQICGYGPLYVLSRHDYAQAESLWSERWTPAEKEFPLGVSMGRCDETQQGTGNLPPDHSLKDELDIVLRKFRQRTVEPSLQLLVTPSRSELLPSALRMLGSSGFCYRARPVVSLCDPNREADGSQNQLREFFRLALLELQQSSVFEGPPGRLFLTYDLAALKDKKYYKAGVLIGWSLAHGGPGPQCIHPALYQVMCGQNTFLDNFDWRDITNPDARLRMKRLQNRTSMDLLSDRLCDGDEGTGLPDNFSADHSLVYTGLVKHYIYHRVASMAAQFTDGLNSCGGLWETMRSHWEAFAPVMTGMGQKTLNKGDYGMLWQRSGEK